MQNYFDTNDCFHTISFESESLSHNFFSASKLVYVLWPYYAVFVSLSRRHVRGEGGGPLNLVIPGHSRDV